MPAPRLPRLTLSGLLLPLLAAGVSASPELTQAWTALANGRPKDVLRVMDGTGASRPERLAWAAAQMSVQPATDDNMRAAEKVLEELAGGNDDLAAEAAYLQARLHQMYYVQPDYPRAAELYRALAARQPQSHWAQLGLVKLAMLKLYVLPDATASDADRLAPAEALLAQIHEPLLQRDLHLQIGQAGVALKQPLARLLPHLVAADRVGGISGTAHEDLIVQIGVLSLRAGLPAQAKEYFERYLREYPDNVRAWNAARLLAEANRQLAKEGGR
jgi:tetratricopeptide (TPR) repeat protein